MQSRESVKAKFHDLYLNTCRDEHISMAIEAFPLNLSLELAGTLRILRRFSNSHPRYFMSALFISLLTLVLILISAFVILLVLMQRTSQSGGMGAALGGGAAESAFGSDTNNILTKGTIYGIIAFFVVALGLFLLYQSEASNRAQIVSAGELISADEDDNTAETVVTVVEEPVAVVEGVDGVEAIVEDVVAVVENAEGTTAAVVESVEVVAPVVDVEASTAETVPASN
jgi:preprotein translocase subunit SecG